MSGSILGQVFRVSTFGESHGPALGCVIDGCPAGLALCIEDINAEMRRRRPGGIYASPRKEEDEISILSGVFEGFTTGAPIALVVYNNEQKSQDYDSLRHVFRPGHADYTLFAKYGIYDHRGGGRASGRETAARVAAGAVAKLILAQLGIKITAKVAAIGDVMVSGNFLDNKQAVELLENCIKNGDSIGSRAACCIDGIKPGMGLPVFDKLSADLAKAVHSIGGVKAVEFGAGFMAAKMFGSENNDEFCVSNDEVCKKSNNAGGMLGGISDGTEIYFDVAFKPPSSIKKEQSTVGTDGNAVQVAVHGRHDPVIAPRACVVIEAMAAIVVVDHIFRSFADTMEGVKRAYESPFCRPVRYP